MLISDRQRLVAETGLLTLLGWMAVTIAFNNPPRQSSAGELPQLGARPTKESQTSSRPDKSISTGATSATVPSISALPSDLAPLSGPVHEPKIALPPLPTPLPKGTVIRMGTGVHVHPEPSLPPNCLTRSATGSSEHGPVP
jgi:hypothetical protein